MVTSSKPVNNVAVFCEFNIWPLGIIILKLNSWLKIEVNEEIRSAMLGWVGLMWIHTLKAQSLEMVSENLRTILTDILSEKESGGEIGFDPTLRNRTLHKGFSSTNSLWNIPEHSLLLSLDSDMTINQTFSFKVKYRIHYTSLFKSTYRKERNNPWGIIHSKCNFIIKFTSSCGGVDWKSLKHRSGPHMTIVWL